MKIVHIVPGSGGNFYCQNCLRDNGLVQALRAAGADVLMVPLYLPQFNDGICAQQDTPVFFGGINVYLQQKFSFFRKSPRWLDRLFDASWLLKWAATMEGSTSAQELGAMTFSMLEGEGGLQEKEVQRLLDWLRDQEQPDIVHISNALLLGLVPALRQGLGDVKIVCSLQDEDGWLDKLGEPYSEQCWKAISELCAQVDSLIAVSQHYADEMERRLDLPNGSVEVEYPGMDCDQLLAERTDGPPVLGFLSRMNVELGLERLVDAYVALKERPGLECLRLIVMGGMVGKDDVRCVKRLQRLLKRKGYLQDVVFSRELDAEKRRAMLDSIDVLSVPVPGGEAFGSYIFEAWAAGVPVVQPSVGAFPEVLELGGGGLIYQNDLLEDALASVLLDRPRCRALGKKGYDVLAAHYNWPAVARRMLGRYRKLLK